MEVCSISTVVANENPEKNHSEVECHVPMYGLQLHSCGVYAVNQVRDCNRCVYEFLGFFWSSLATTVLSDCHVTSRAIAVYACSRTIETCRPGASKSLLFCVT